MISSYSCLLLLLPSLLATGFPHNNAHPPPSPPTVQQFTHNLQAHVEQTHYVAQQHAHAKQRRHYNTHAQKAQELYHTHMQSMTQREAMKKKDPSMAHAVDVYYDTLSSEYNVHRCRDDPSILHADRVNDGICDCCDGSDEVPGRCGTPRCRPSLDTLQKLQSWMVKQGITGAAMPYGKKDGSGNGMKVSKVVKRGEVLLSVPIALAYYVGGGSKQITRKTTAPAGKTTAGKKDLATLPEVLTAMEHMLTPNAYVAMVLLHDMNQHGQQQQQQQQKQQQQQPPRTPPHPHGHWLDALPLYVKSIFHTATDRSWLQQQSPATDLLVHLSNLEQSECVKAYHQLYYGMVQEFPHLFQPHDHGQKWWSLARYVHAFTLVTSRAIEMNLNEVDPARVPTTPTQPAAANPPPAPQSAYKQKQKQTQTQNQQAQKQPQHNGGKVVPDVPRYSPVVVPIMDMFNHPPAVSPFTPDFHIKHGRFEMIATRTYAKDEAVYVVYGSGTTTSEGHLTETGSGSTSNFVHHYNFWNHRNTKTPQNEQQEQEDQNQDEEVEYVRVSLTYVLQHDQSGCGGATETGVVEQVRRHRYRYFTV